MNPVFLKVGDTLPVYQIVISGDTAPLNLTGFTGVQLRLKPRYTGTASSYQGTVIDSTNGVVEYKFTTGTTTTPGTYFAEWILQGSSGNRTYPQSYHINLEIISGLM